MQETWVRSLGWEDTQEKGKAIHSSILAWRIPWTIARQVLCSWGFPGKNTGVGGHALLQGILPIQGLNPGLLHCGQILYQLSHKGELEPTHL